MFDWVAEKGNKTWALNYITLGESHVGLFNITPVLYVLEVTNKSSGNIQLIVENMINATR